MDALWIRCVKKAALADPVVVSGAGALVLSAAAGSALPSFLWALAATGWVVLLSTSPRFARQVLAEERASMQHAESEARVARRAELAEALSQTPYTRWVADGRLPDYANRAAGLERARAEVTALAAGRPELAVELTLRLGQDLDELLELHLALASARLAGLRLLRAVPTANARVPAVRELEEQLGELHKRIELEPAAASIRESHREVLERRLATLQLAVARDARLAAKLDALPDLLSWVVERLREPGSDGLEVSGQVERLLADLQDEGGSRASRPATPAGEARRFEAGQVAPRPQGG